VDREVVTDESYMGRGWFQTHLAAGWLPTYGPWVAGGLGMHHAMRLELGTTRKPVKVQQGKTKTVEAGDFTFAIGFRLLALSFNGWQLDGGLMMVGSRSLRGQVSVAVPLNAAWMPKRLPDLRARLHYMTADIGDADASPQGIGASVEWGAW